ncbi:MAG: hypothetical protein ACI4OX_08945 [Akkermansia sp.]
MRLHLPKGLLAALLAACFALPAGAEGETTTQYGWTNGAPATSPDGTTWTSITYDEDHTLSTFTDTDDEGNPTYTIALGTLGDVEITGVPGGAWGTGSTVTGTADSAWFNMTENKRIYLSCPDISKMSNVYMNGVHFVIGTGNSNKDTSNDISSNLFLGAGAWADDSGTVHYKAVLRANVNANISGNVTLTDSSAHISTWGGSDITFGGGLNGNGKSLSVGAQVLGSVINLNGTTNLGSLTVGAMVDTSGSLSAQGAAISIVIGASATAEIGNLTLLSGSTLTNNGQLSISGTYTGGTISQIDGANLTLGDGAIVNLDSLDFARVITDTQTSTRGTYKKQYTLVNGGSFSIAENVSYQLGGVTATGSLTDAVYFADQENPYYNIVKGETADYSTITAGDAVDFIRVEGTLTAGSSVTHEIMLVGGTLQGTGAASTYSGLLMRQLILHV